MNRPPLDQSLHRSMLNQKIYSFEPEPQVSLFSDPHDLNKFITGAFLENVEIRKVRDLWLQTGQGKDFLLNHDYNWIRYPHLEKFMEKSSVVWAPTMRLSGNSGIQFIQGRHRFLWFSVHKYDTISLVVPPVEEGKFRSMLY